MKGRWAALSAAILLLAGCGAAGLQPAEEKGVDLETVVEKLSHQYQLTMPSPVDDQFLEKIFGVNPEDTVDYAGRLSMSAASADSVLAVRPAEGKEETVRRAMEERLEFVQESFRQFQPESYEKARAGTVCQEGDSLFLLILGREGKEPSQEIQAAVNDLEEWLKE